MVAERRSGAFQFTFTTGGCRSDCGVSSYKLVFGGFVAGGGGKLSQIHSGGRPDDVRIPFSPISSEARTIEPISGKFDLEALPRGVTLKIHVSLLIGFDSVKGRISPFSTRKRHVRYHNIIIFIKSHKLTQINNSFYTTNLPVLYVANSARSL